MPSNLMKAWYLKNPFYPWIKKEVMLIIILLFDNDRFVLYFSTDEDENIDIIALLLLRHQFSPNILVWKILGRLSGRWIKDNHNPSACSGSYTGRQEFARTPIFISPLVCMRLFLMPHRVMSPHNDFERKYN